MTDEEKIAAVTEFLNAVAANPANYDVELQRLGLSLSRAVSASAPTPR